jgi:hypothetical protein
MPTIIFPGCWQQLYYGPCGLPETNEFFSIRACSVPVFIELVCSVLGCKIWAELKHSKTLKITSGLFGRPVLAGLESKKHPKTLQNTLGWGGIKTPHPPSVLLGFAHVKLLTALFVFWDKCFGTSVLGGSYFHQKHLQKHSPKL